MPSFAPDDLVSPGHLTTCPRFHLDHLPKVMEVAMAGCRDIHTIMDAAVRSHVARTGAQLGWKE